MTAPEAIFRSLLGAFALIVLWVWVMDKRTKL
jgi:hypothetical protein